MVIAGVLLAQKWDYKQLFLELEQKHQDERTQLTNDLTDREAKVANLKEALKERTQSAIEANNKLTQEQQDNEKLKRESARFNETLANLRTDIKNINDRLAEKDTRISKLEEDRDKAKKEAEDYRIAKEAAQEQMYEMEIQLNNLQGQLGEKEKLVQNSQKELWEAKQITSQLKGRGINVSGLLGKEKPLDGIVTAIDAKLPIVMLSVGKDDGVEKGYQFTVYRGSEYIGRVVVEEVYKDASAGRVVKEMSVKTIQKGDNATTRIGATRGS